MNRRLATFLSTIPALWLGWQPIGGASEIYRWVDDEGVVHYSDTKPEYDSDVTTLHLEESKPTNYDPTADPNSILNQARRMTQAWIELADAREARVEQRRRQAESDPQVAAPVYELYTYRRPTPYFSTVPVVGDGRSHAGIARRQHRALETLDLAGPRPHSINSSAHRARVSRSESLPIVVPNTGPHRPPSHR